MKRMLYLIILLMIATLTIGCTKGTGQDTRAIKAPNNNTLEIYGIWEVESIKIFEEELNVFEDIDSINDKHIEFTNDKIDLLDSIYLNPKYKLKSVDKNYVLSYELNLTIEEFMNGKERVDVISMTSNNNMIGEFILTEEDKGYIIYMGALIEVNRISDTSISNSDINAKNDEVEENNNANYYTDVNYYNSETGVMLGLKKPRVEKEDGTFTTEEYRTLWISFKDGQLMPIVEKKNIIFPRVNGIWSLENKVLEMEISNEEYFEVSSLDGKTVSNYEKIDKDVYKNITFIGNDYIGIEEYIGDGFNNVFIKYGVIPIDNINSNSGLNIEELYSKDIINKYKNEYEKALNNFYADNYNKDSNIDNSNFTVKRKDGKWGLVGNLGIINEQGKSREYSLNLRPNSKLLNYDILPIPWKQLRSEIPLIRDAYISPNERIAIILFEDNLAIYEIKDKMLKGAPLANINIGNEEVIMAEWSTGAYVENWSKAFKDGTYITN